MTNKFNTIEHMFDEILLFYKEEEQADDNKPIKIPEKKPPYKSGQERQDESI